MIGVSARFPAVFGRFRAEAVIMVVKPAFGGAARRKGRPVPAREAGPHDARRHRRPGASWPG
jgi:hypothetical protein